MTERFNNAVTKLYTAFHEGTLDYGLCQKCAVGTILGHGTWLFNSPSTIWARMKGRELTDMTLRNNNSGYNLKELVKVEKVFILAFKNSKNPSNKESQFKGLCAVIEYLAKLDNIPNPFNFDNLFNQDKEIASLELAVIEN